MTIASEAEMLLALRSHFHSPEYVLLPQVRNGAGFSANRTADAMAMSVWPSRGLHLYGIEIKVSRGDWVRELKNPKKADDIGKFCDFWMIAAGNDEIVRAGELPSGWGLLIPGKKPNTLKVSQAPTKIEAQPLHRSFLASILRVVAEETMPFKQVDAEIERRVNEKAEIHRLAQEAVVEFDKGEYPSRTLVARIREIAGTFPKLGIDNTPLRMWIALTLLRAWNSGTAGFDASVVSTVNAWIDGGMQGPIPWPGGAFFEEWAGNKGLSKVGDGYVGFRIKAKMIDKAVSV